MCFGDPMSMALCAFPAAAVFIHLHAIASPMCTRAGYSQHAITTWRLPQSRPDQANGRTGRVPSKGVEQLRSHLHPARRENRYASRPRWAARSSHASCRIFKTYRGQAFISALSHNTTMDRPIQFQTQATERHLMYLRIGSMVCTPYRLIASLLLASFTPSGV